MALPTSSRTASAGHVGSFLTRPDSALDTIADGVERATQLVASAIIRGIGPSNRRASAARVPDAAPVTGASTPAMRRQEGTAADRCPSPEALRLKGRHLWSLSLPYATGAHHHRRGMPVVQSRPGSSSQSRRPIQHRDPDEWHSVQRRHRNEVGFGSPVGPGSPSPTPDSHHPTRGPTLRGALPLRPDTASVTCRPPAPIRR